MLCSKGCDQGKGLSQGLGQAEVPPAPPRPTCSCGSSFEVYVTSPQFEGRRLLERHKMVNAAVAKHMDAIHALSIKRTKTPAEMAAVSSA